MFAVLAWTAVEMERVSGLATLKPDALAAMHESPFVYLSSLSPQQVREGVGSFTSSSLGLKSMSAAAVPYRWCVGGAADEVRMSDSGSGWFRCCCFFQPA